MLTSSEESCIRRKCVSFEAIQRSFCRSRIQSATTVTTRICKLYRTHSYQYSQ